MAKPFSDLKDEFFDAISKPAHCPKGCDPKEWQKHQMELARNGQQMVEFPEVLDKKQMKLANKMFKAHRREEKRPKGIVKHGQHIMKGPA